MFPIGGGGSSARCQFGQCTVHDTKTPQQRPPLPSRPVSSSPPPWSQSGLSLGWLKRMGPDQTPAIHVARSRASPTGPAQHQAPRSCIRTQRGAVGGEEGVGTWGRDRGHSGRETGKKEARSSFRNTECGTTGSSATGHARWASAGQRARFLPSDSRL